MKLMLSKDLYLAFQYYYNVKLLSRLMKFRKGTGYYFVTEGLTKVFEMDSGYTVNARLTYYSYHCDPSDMVKQSFWEITGFPGKTPILECSKDQFIDIYGDYYYTVMK